MDIDANDTMAEVYKEKIRAAAEVGEGRDEDGRWYVYWSSGKQIWFFGSVSYNVSGKEGVSTTKDFATALGYTTDLYNR